MYKSFEEDLFRQAIANGDKKELKNIVINVIRNDPTFSYEEFPDVINRLENSNLDIFEAYRKLDNENIIGDKSQWDRRYFTRLTRYLRYNFAKERFEYIKKVGNVVYADLANSIKEENKHPFQQAPKQKKQSENRPKRRKINRNRNIAISIGVGAGVIALVLVIAKILK